MEIAEIYENFGRMLEDGSLNANSRIEYVDFCRNSGVDAGEFDRYVRLKAGMSVEEVMEIYRKTSSSDSL